MHGKQLHCSFTIQGGNAYLGFPNFTLQANVDNEITLDIAPFHMQQGTECDYSNDKPTITRSPTLLVYLLHEDAKIPTKASQDVAGYDLYSAKESITLPGEQQRINTGVNV
eukprot:9694443-Ditylum_brightwellii.AAC.1